MVEKKVNIVERAILFSYFEKKAKELFSKFEVSSEQQASRNLGDNREIFVNEFLKNSLPSKLKVKSGEIWDKNGNKTGQLDTIIVRDDGPSLDFGGENTYLAEGVFGVIEVKSNLTTEKIKEAAKTLSKVSKLNIPKPTITMGGHNISKPLRVLFAYKGASWKTILKTIDENSFQNLFDLICILDKGVYIKRGNLLYAYDKTTGTKFDKDFILETEASALGFLYYYLIQYGVSFSTGIVNLEEYFQPLEKWGK